MGNRNNSNFFNNSPVAKTNAVRKLGVSISNQLGSHSYCIHIAFNASWKIRQLKLAFECSDEKFRTGLYTVYVRPILEYNTQVWNPHSVGDIDLIEGIQRKFNKFIF